MPSLMPNLSVTIPLLPEVRQHNALINSPFSLSTLEWRTFTALLQRINPDDAEFKEHFIPASELVDLIAGGSAYTQLQQLSKQITKQVLYVEQISMDGSRMKDPDYEYIPLLAKASYVKNRGGLVLIVNPLFSPYLLQLAEKGNFTKSRAAELKHLKGSHSFKIYWLLSEYRTFGYRTFTVAELRFRLGIMADEYAGRFNNFKAKVLDKAQEELANTDLAFQFELLRVGKVVEKIRFTFSSKPLRVTASATKMPPLDTASATKMPLPVDSVFEHWEQELQQIGVSKEGLNIIRRHMSEGQYPVAYIDYVLLNLRKPRKSAIRKPADYAFKCITGKLLLDEYYRSLETPSIVPSKAVRKAPNKPGLVVNTEEKVIQLSEVQYMYENPGPFAKRNERAPNLEEHLRRIYLSQGFVLETRNGVQVLVMKSQGLESEYGKH
jgi:hypothetical protein